VQPAGQGGDGGHLHRRPQVHGAAGGDQAVLNAQCRQGAGGLLQQLDPVHQHRNPIAACCRLLGDVAEHHGLAAAGGQHEQHGSVPGHEGQPHPLDGVVLVGAQGEDHG